MVNSKLRRHKIMERVIRRLMGNNLPPRFKFKDTYNSISVPPAFQQYLPTQQQLETEFNEEVAQEEALPPVISDTTELKIIGKNLYSNTVTGNFGIGTPNPSVPLEVVGSVKVSSNIEIGTANLFVDTATSNVGVGTTTPLYPLHVIGNIYGTGNITAYSDKRAKSDIVKIENALDKIDQLNGYTYTMNDERYTGLIAQEVLPVLPEAVVGSEETSYAIAYGNMMGLVIEAIKELRKRTETQ
jgi:hypothetical protein